MVSVSKVFCLVQDADTRCYVDIQVGDVPHFCFLCGLPISLVEGSSFGRVAARESGMGGLGLHFGVAEENSASEAAELSSSSEESSSSGMRKPRRSLVGEETNDSPVGLSDEGSCVEGDRRLLDEEKLLLSREAQARRSTGSDPTGMSIFKVVSESLVLFLGCSSGSILSPPPAAAE